jgi:hypothetical protein
LLVGLQPAAEEALGKAVNDELGEAARRAAQERADREHRDADDKISLAAEHIAEPPRNRQYDAVGDQVGSQRPRRLIAA